VEKDNGVAVGETIKDWVLCDLSGATHRLSQYQGKVVLMVFWSAECPVSEKYDGYFNGLRERYAGEQLALVGVDANQNYGEEEIAAAVQAREIHFPVLRDRDAAVANRFGALTTPHVYIIDREGHLAYQGAVDDYSFRQPEPTVNYVDQALEAILAGETPPVAETQPYGCTIVRHA
jgi:peroxiredoxin